MKKYLVFILIIIILIILGTWAPWLNWDLSLSKIFRLESKSVSSGLKVYSLLGELEVYLDNEYQGSITPDDYGLEILDLSPGLKDIKLKRKSNPDGSYYELSRKVNFEEGVDVIISYELGPSLKFSEGHIFYAEKNLSTSDTKLNIISSPAGARLYLNNNFVGETPLSNIEIDLNEQLEVKLEKDNYDTIIFDILPESQDEREKLKGFTLNLEINMFLIPIDLNIIDGEE